MKSTANLHLVAIIHCLTAIVSIAFEIAIAEPLIIFILVVLVLLLWALISLRTLSLKY